MSETRSGEAYSARYYRQNRDLILARMKRKREEDPAFQARVAKRSKDWQDQNKLRVRALQKKWKTENGRHYKQTCMLSSARRRAVEKGWEFNLTIEDVSIPEVCPVFGMPFNLGAGKSDASPSLDRVDNSRGYVRGNVVVVSELANRMKSSGTIAQLRKLADFYEHIGGISQP